MSSRHRDDRLATVEVWVARATRELAIAWRSAVPAPERRELGSLREAERDRRTVQLAVRRSVLAARLGCPPRDVAVATTVSGGIVVPSATLKLSASHYDDVTVLALTEGPGRLGIDVEPLHEPGWDDALDEVLTARELEALDALPPSERPAAYFTCWTLKEAVMKALGEGLSDRDPKSIDVTLPPSPARLVSLDGSRPASKWSLATISLEEHACSIALVGSGAMTIEMRRWPVDLPPLLS